jgi:hypothetical protein
MTQVMDPLRVDPRASARGVGAPSIVVVLCATAGVGVLAGVAGLLAESLVDSPVWMSVFHRLTPWVGVTVAVGFALRARPRVAAVAGLTVQLGLVASYYLGEACLTGRPLDVWSSVAYSLLALVTGPLYGAAGALLSTASTLPRALVLGAASGAVVADGVRVITAVAAVRVHVVPSLLVGVGFVLTGVVLAVVVARTRRDLLAILLGGAAFCGLVVLGLDVLLV